MLAPVPAGIYLFKNVSHFVLEFLLLTLNM